MSTARATVTVFLGRLGFLDALRQMFADNHHFNHRQWAIDDAEELERAARMIRAGYEAERSDIKENT